MAVTVAHLVPGKPRRLDELCTVCWCSGIWEVDVFWLSPSGVSLCSTVRTCDVCRHRA